MEIAILSVGIIAVVLLVITLIIVSIKNDKPTAGTADGSFSESQEDYITLQLEGILQIVKGYIKEDGEKVQDSITRQLTMQNSNVMQMITVGQDGLVKSVESFNKNQENSFRSLESKLMEHIAGMRKEVGESLTKQSDRNLQDNNNLRELLDNKLHKMQKEVGENLNDIRNANDKKLDQMREMVDDKLQDTLNKRIDESFKLISEQLSAVHKGLGEMSSLSDGVHNLNKVMSNIKTRGIWGEVALDNLLEQVLTPDQYGSQVNIEGREAVDFAIYLPGTDKNERVILPIDVKFPLSDYERLIDASEIFDKDAVLQARKALLNRIKTEAKEISRKYIIVPKTTNFAIMYLPTEGLFAEVVREVGLLEELQSKYKIVLSGPTTISALLNSLQIGFRTLQIQEKSADVWKALNKFKSEFTKFTTSLDKVGKQVNTVAGSVEESIKRTRIIQKALGSMGDMSQPELTIDIIGGIASDEIIED